MPARASTAVLGAGGGDAGDVASRIVDANFHFDGVRRNHAHVYDAAVDLVAGDQIGCSGLRCTTRCGVVDPDLGALTKRWHSELLGRRTGRLECDRLRRTAV